MLIDLGSLLCPPSNTLTLKSESICLIPPSAHTFALDLKVNSYLGPFRTRKSKPHNMSTKRSKKELDTLAQQISELRSQKLQEEKDHTADHIHEMHFLIGKEINAARVRLDISKKEFAERIGIDQGQLSRWLSGRTNLTVNSIARMQVALGEPVVSVAGHAYKSFSERELKGCPF